jgi:hypothetical protein
MAKEIKITYTNKSMNKDLPTVFVFTKNETPTFDTLKEGIVWRTLPNIGRGSSSSFIFPIETEVGATWNDGMNKTKKLLSTIGKRYTVSKNDAGIVLEAKGNASNSRSIDVNNNTNLSGGISVSFYKDGKLMLKKKIEKYGQKETFVLRPKLYWGIASQIQEGELINSAVLNTDHFFELELDDDVSEVKVSLNGNAQEGYKFKTDSQK